MNLKTILAPVVLLLLSRFLAAEEPVKYATLNTKSGKTYTGVTIREATTTHVKILHASGIATIAFEDLPKNVQKALNYDPVKAAEYAKAQAAKQQAPDVSETKPPLIDWIERPLSERYTISPPSANNVKLEYNDYQWFVLDLKSKAKTELLPDEVLKKQIAVLPQGGAITVYLERSTIEAANSKYCLIIVSDLNGTEIFRSSGRDKIADVPISAGGPWRNLSVAFLPKPIEDGINVRVVDTLFNTYAEFSIHSTK
jgi:hypothetical protein